MSEAADTYDRTPSCDETGKWQETAGLLGVTYQAILLWRKGEQRPSYVNILAITELTFSIPGGFQVLCQGDAGALTPWVKDGEGNVDGRE